jgi:hypothetical protein
VLGCALERGDGVDLALVDEEEVVVTDAHVSLELQDDVSRQLGPIPRLGRQVLEADPSLRVEAIQVNGPPPHPERVVLDDREARGLEAALEGRGPLQLRDHGPEATPLRSSGEGGSTRGAGDEERAAEAEDSRGSADQST